MINQIFPLFNYNEIDEANEYLVKYLFDRNQIQVMTDFINEVNMDEIEYVITQILKETCKNMFGVNSPQIANFIIVQNFVYGKLKNILLRYIEYTNLDGSIIDWFPSDYTSTVLSKRFMENGYKPLDRNWSPNEIWDFQKDVPAKNLITSPVNGFMHMTLILKNVENYEFLLALNRYGVLSSKEIKDNNYKFDELEIKLLPYNNFNKVLNIANAIFKYY